MGIDVGAFSAEVHEVFEVTITVSRDGEDDREESAVFYLGAEAPGGWDMRNDIERRGDALSVRQDVDIQQSDTITCSDTTIVPSETSWVVIDRKPTMSNAWVDTWRLEKLSGASETSAHSSAYSSAYG